MRFLAPFLALFLTSGPAFASDPHEVRLNGHVTEESVAEAIEGLTSARGYVVLRIDSPGGSVTAGFRLIHAIEDSPIPVVCVVDGTAASMGALILESCKTRIMTKRSVLMFHEPSISTDFSGHESDWRNIADRLRAMHRATSAWVCARLHVPLAEFIARTQGGGQWWMAWDEALKTGAVDQVVDSVAQVVAGAK